MLSKQRTVFRTAENTTGRNVEIPPPSGTYYSGVPCFDLDSAAASHRILGFGASFTDSSCYTLSRLDPAGRKQWLGNLFSASGLNLNIGRLNVGASDYSRQIYSYDDTPDDFELADFSIAPDTELLIPLLCEVRRDYAPDLFLFASPWSPPGWMKTSGSMCGGWMRWKYLPVFADYLVRYLEEFRKAGIDIGALTLQNECCTDQTGRMPASNLHPDFEIELVKLLDKRLKKSGLDTAVWLFDHNYINWARVIYTLSDPEVLAIADSVAFHPYHGNPEMMREVRKRFPQIKLQLTEKGPNLRPDSVENTLLWWSSTVSDAVNAGSSSFCGWNLALDEHGEPNLGSYDCAGLITVNSETRAVTVSSQYRAFYHYSHFIRRGAEVLSGDWTPFLPSGIDVLAVRNPDGENVLVLGNHSSKPEGVQFKQGKLFWKILLPPQTMTTAISR